MPNGDTIRTTGSENLVVAVLLLENVSNTSVVIAVGRDQERLMSKLAACPDTGFGLDMITEMMYQVFG